MVQKRNHKIRDQEATIESLQQELAELEQQEQYGSSTSPQQHASRGRARPATAPAHRSPGSEVGLFSLRSRAGSAARHRSGSGALRQLPGL